MYILWIYYTADMWLHFLYMDISQGWSGATRYVFGYTVHVVDLELHSSHKYIGILVTAL